MSKDLFSMGSKSKPPVLQLGEYPQWHLRMTQFLNNIDKSLMISIQEGPIKPYIDVSGEPETTTTPVVPPRRVLKLYHHFNEAEKQRFDIYNNGQSRMICSIVSIVDILQGIMG